MLEEKLEEEQEQKMLEGMCSGEIKSCQNVIRHVQTFV